MTIPMDAIGLAFGFLLDLFFADPRRGHPVALFGRLAGAIERIMYRDSRIRGFWYVLLLVGGSTAIGYAISSQIHNTWLRIITIAIITWIVLGGTSLIKEARSMSEALVADDLPAARIRLGSLCGRDARFLDANSLARATIESVAENTSDAVVAPLFWGAFLGVPGLLAYRALNTLDAMVGYRSPRYAKFGLASAKLDDLANLIPARITGLLSALFSRVVGGSFFETLQVMHRDGSKHPSPNSGQAESAFAGALGITLGGTSIYAGEIVNLPQLGAGRTVEVVDIAAANRLSRAVQIGAAIMATSASLLITWLR
jgi:adenosylcobinamide-phosphate synthase